MTTLWALKQLVRTLFFVILIPKTATGQNFAQTQFQTLSHCSVDSRYNNGKLLKTLGIMSSLECARQCTEHKDCYSINVGPANAENKVTECHLLADSSTSCSDLTAAQGWIYFRKIQALETVTPKPACKTCSGDLKSVLEVDYTGSIRSGDKTRLKEAVLGGSKVKIVTETSGRFYSYSSMLHVIDQEENIHFMPKTKFVAKSDGKLSSIDQVISTSGEMTTVTRLYESKTNYTTVSKANLMTFYTTDNSCNVSTSEITLESLLDGVSKGHELGVQLWNYGLTEVFKADPVISDAEIHRVSGATYFSHKLDHANPHLFFEPLTRELKLVSTNDELQVMTWPWTSPYTINVIGTSNSNVKWTIDSCWETVVHFHKDDPGINPDKTLKLSGPLQKGRMVKVSYFDTNGVMVTVRPDLVICTGDGFVCNGSSVGQGGRRTDSPFDLGIMQSRVYNTYVRATFATIKTEALGFGNRLQYDTSVTWYAETRPSTVVFNSTDVNLEITMLHKAIKMGAELQLLIKDDHYEQYIRVSEAVIDSSNGMWLETVDSIVDTIHYRGICQTSQYPHIFKMKFSIPSLSLKVTSWEHDLSLVCVQEADFLYQSVTVFAAGEW